MSRPFKTTGIHISSGLVSCAYHCRYCQLAHIKATTFGIDRFVSVVDRFLNYKAKHSFNEFNVSFWNGYSYDSPINDFQKELNLYKRVGEWELKILLLGGLPHMDDTTLKQWFSDRKAIGSEFATATYTGIKEKHDYWNNKKGNFEFLLNAQKIAEKVGLENEQRILLTRSSLAQMDELLDTLDTLEIHIKDRAAYPFFYSGLAKHYENERVTMEILDSQSDRIKGIYRNDKDKWKSERDWIEFSRTNNGSQYESGTVSLILTDKNIDRIESMSCEEILDDLTKRTNTAYNSVPSREELAAKYSDSSNEKIYMFMWDMECLWLDRYLKENPTQFERELTHYGR